MFVPLGQFAYECRPFVQLVGSITLPSFFINNNHTVQGTASTHPCCYAVTRSQTSVPSTSTVRRPSLPPTTPPTSEAQHCYPHLVAASAPAMKPSLKWFGSKTSPSTSPEPAGPSAGPGGNNSYRASPSSVSAASRNPSPSDSTTDSPSSLLHPSSPSPSPTPQPPTPRDSVFPRSDFSLPAASKPIDIAGSHRRSTSSISPADRNPITFPTQDHDDLDLDLDIDWDQGPCLADAGFDPDIDMTAGQHFDSALSRSRQESFLGTGAKPISMANPNRDHANRMRRESMAGSLRAGSLMAGSLMGNGMSWGGISVGSFIREE